MDKYTKSSEGSFGASATGHDTIRDLLPAYLAATARGQDAGRLYPDLFAHIANCAACQDEVSELEAILMPAYLDNLPPVAIPAVADLSFLSSEAAATETNNIWTLDALGRLMVQFSQAILDATRPAITLAGALRGDLLHSVDVPAADENEIDLRIEIFSTRDNSAVVSVDIDDPHLDPLDQSGALVTLLIGGKRLQHPTDNRGNVTFKDLPLSQLPTMAVAIQRAGADA